VPSCESEEITPIRTRGMSRRYIHEMLLEAAGRASGHMPGHKGRAPFGVENLYALDTTELPCTDDLYAPENGILQAQEAYAKAAGAAKSILLHNGSSAGIHGMMQLWAREGETVILGRNAHLSAVNGAIMGGVNIVWIPAHQTQDGYCIIRPEDALKTLRENPHARAILLTRPDYYGGMMQLEEIIAQAHQMGVRVAVDEAHGAHLPWLEGVPSAGELGADAWVQSVHKTLPGLTGSAVLHLADAADAPRALALIRRSQTSSPSFVLMMSADDARVYMEETGSNRLREVVQAANKLRRELQGYRDAHETWRETGMTFDPTRLVIEAPQGGEKLAQQLARYGVDVEMHDDRRVVIILTAMDDACTVEKIAAALKEIPPEKMEMPQMAPLLPLPEKAMDVRRAVMAETEPVALNEAEGRIAAASAGLYPPGIPLVCPGEIITKEVIARLSGAENRQRFGVEGNGISCVRKNDSTSA